MLSCAVHDAAFCAPVPGAHVTIRDANENVLVDTRTDPEGQWTLAVSEGAVSVCFSHPGFVSKCVSVGELPQMVRLLADALIGYHENLWSQPGQQERVFVHAPNGCHATLKRYGVQVETVMDLGEHPVCVQNVPDGTFVDTGPGWRSSLEYTIPDDARPGLYFLALTDAQNGRFDIPLIVSTPQHARGRNSVLVLSSTNTWQSYNVWGGRSRYRNFETIATAQPALMSFLQRISPHWVRNTWGAIKARYAHAPDWVFERLSVRRPFTHCKIESENPTDPFTNQFAGAEWRFLAWLERESISYDLVAGVELHNAPDLPGHYDAVVFIGHCEYWSRQMYEAVKAAHEEKGLWVLNLSGNTLFREIEVHGDGSTQCVSLSFKDSCEDETQLIGVRFTAAGYGTCAPYKVLEPASWVFEGIDGVTRGTLIGQRCLNQATAPDSEIYNPGRPSGHLLGQGASGWETDKLSATAPSDFQLIAKGTNGVRGGADMVLREPAGTRGGCFSASSIVFTAALLVDEAASRLTRNVIARSVRRSASPD